MSVNTYRSRCLALPREGPKGIQDGFAHARISEALLQMAIGNSQVGIVGEITCDILHLEVIGVWRWRWYSHCPPHTQSPPHRSPTSANTLVGPLTARSLYGSEEALLFLHRELKRLCQGHTNVQRGKLDLVFKVGDITVGAADGLGQLALRPPLEFPALPNHCPIAHRIVFPLNPILA
jgi:hypothetical protein